MLFFYRQVLVFLQNLREFLKLRKVHGARKKWKRLLKLVMRQSMHYLVAEVATKYSSQKIQHEPTLAISSISLVVWALLPSESPAAPSPGNDGLVSELCDCSKSDLFRFDEFDIRFR